MFASLRHRNYRLYFTGQLISQLGNWLQNAAQAWMVLELTHSAQAVGVLGFFLYGPYALFGLVGGALADRYDHRRTVIVTQIAMTITAFGLTLAAFFKTQNVGVIYALAAVRGLILVVNNPSRQALMVRLVGRPELSNAIALNSSLNNASRVIGPGIAGLLIATVGITICFALNTISFVAVIAALFAMRASEFYEPRDVKARTSMWTSIREGLVFAGRRKTVAVSLGMFFIVSFLAINFNVLIPVLAQQTLHGGPEVYGALSSIFGAGALLGALIAASRTRASPRLVLISATGFGLSLLALAYFRNIWTVGAGLFSTGVFYTLYTSGTNSLVQLATPSFMQGRVSGLYFYVFVAPGPIGSLLVGWMCERGGTELALLMGAAATIAMVLVGVGMWPWPMPAGSIRARRTPRRSARI